MSRNLKIFAVADKINGNGLMMSGTAYTAGAFIRDSLPYFKHRGFDFMNEGLLYEIVFLYGLQMFFHYGKSP